VGSLIDTHVHISQIPSDVVEQQLAEARALGTSLFVEVGTTVEGSRRSLAFAEARDDFLAGVAVHPTRVDQYNADAVPALTALLGSSKKIVCIGECGLDYGSTGGDRDKIERQQQMMRDMIRLAREHQLPLNTHCDRESARDLLRILREERAFEVGGMLHNFSGSIDLAQGYLDLGFYVSVCVAFCHPRADRLKNVWKQLPLGQIVLDSDAPGAVVVRTPGDEEPYMYDMDKHSEPRMLRYIANLLAEVKELPVEDVEAVTSLNARRLFRLPAAG